MSNTKAIILWEGDSYYKDKVEQEEGVDILDRNVEVEVNPCDGDITIPNILSNKVPIEEVWPQEGEFDIPLYLVMHAMLPLTSKKFLKFFDLEHNKPLNLRISFLQEGENDTI